MRGQISFLSKGMYLVVVLVVIALLANRIADIRGSLSEQTEREYLRGKAWQIVDVLAGNVECLAYVEEGKIEGKKVELVSHRVLDVRKLEEFARKYSEIQPKCMKDFENGYRVKVSIIPFNLQSVGVAASEGVFDEIFSLIDGKKVVFSLDSSGSMIESAGVCEADPKYKNSKICCLKLFMSGFIDRMSEGSEIAVNAYSSGYKEYYKWLIYPFHVLDTDREELKKKIEGLTPMMGTPMCRGLKAAFELIEKEGGDAIVLLTDGCENVGCRRTNSVEIAENYADLGVPVYTIAFGTSACYSPLERIAKITDGEFFEAKTCEELIPTARERLNLTVEEKTWEFGNSEFSEGEAVSSRISLSTSVIVRFNETTFLPGILRIILVKGELEVMRGMIERTCVTQEEISRKLFFHYPLYLKEINGNQYVCLKGIKERCQRVDCGSKVEFSGIPRGGLYEITIKKVGDRVVVKV